SSPHHSRPPIATLFPYTTLFRSVDTGYPSAQVATIPNSSDNVEFAHNEAAAREFRDARPWLGDRPLLVYTGTFGKINGVRYLAKDRKSTRLNSSHDSISYAVFCL